MLKIGLLCPGILRNGIIYIHISISKLKYIALCMHMCVACIKNTHKGIIHLKNKVKSLGCGDRNKFARFYNSCCKIKKLLRYFTKDGNTVHQFNCRRKLMENMNAEDRYPAAPFSLFWGHQVPRTWGWLLCTSLLVTLFILLQLQNTLQITMHFEAVQSHTILMHIKDLHWGKLCYHGIFLRTSGG